MSRIGKMPVALPQGVKANMEGHQVTLVGPKGTTVLRFPREVGVELKDGSLVVTALGNSRLAKALHGTIRALIANGVKGVSEGWVKQLEIVGTGYRAESAGKDLTLTLGFSHPVKLVAPEGISFKVEKNVISVEGIDRGLVGQMAADIRASRPPEPYQGKGIHYVGEVIRRKAGKAAKAQGAA